MTKRLLQIGWSAALNMTPTFTNLVAAWMVLHFASDATWGSFVAIQLVVGLGLHVLAWGNKDYLLRIFAQSSSGHSDLWKQVLVSRGALLFIAMPVLLLLFPAQTAAMLLLWMVAGFVRQSFDAVVTFKRALAFGALSELGVSVVMLSVIFFLRAQLTMETLVTVYAIGQGARALPFLVYFGREFLLGSYPSIQFRYFQAALPFFLLGLAGLLVARMELYCLLANSGPDGTVTATEIAHYQIWTSLLIYLQTISAFILQPMNKFLYRLPLPSMWKLSRRMVMWGTMVVVLGLPAIWLLLQYWYRIDLPWLLYPLALLYVVPVYYTAPLVFHLFKHHAQQKVLVTNGAAILLNLGTSILLIPRIGIAGAMIASAMGQLITVALMTLYVKRIHATFKPE